jgi:N-methylhydantoinase A
MWRVGVDVGGTFTDLFAWNIKTGERRTAKVLTTRHDRSEGVCSAVDKAGIPFEDISHFMHGTTTATNALLERSFPDAALITTEGFRDTIEIGRQHRQALYDPYQKKPQPIIARRFRFTLNERMGADGKVVTPIDLAEAVAVAKEIERLGLQAVAIGFINSYANPAHERQMRDVLLEHAPKCDVVLSAETRPVFREHGRFTTTAIRAAVMPVMKSYFDRLANKFEERGFKGALLTLKSNGGVMGVALAKDHPEELIESGPAGGVSYASYLSRACAHTRLIHTDLGGTSYDASIVEDGVGLVTRNYELEWEIPIVVPMLDIHSVGAGGGSIAWIDEGGSLRVGPASAGSEPGPACYGRGGTKATITDANLILGRIQPTLGGKMQLDIEAAKRAVQPVANAIGLSVLDTAEGMIRIACESMGQAVKMVLLSRGRDPRDFAIASFGGAGPMHACFVAQAMNIPTVVVPPYAGVASAFGATCMDIRHDLEEFFYAPVDSMDLATVNRLYEQLEVRGRERLAADGVSASDVVMERSAQMRYVGQTYEVDTPIPHGWLDESNRREMVDAFHREHLREHGVSSDDFKVAIVSLSVKAIGKVTQPPVERGVKQGKCAAPSGTRPVYFNGRWIDTQVFSGEALGPGASLDGPAVIEYDDSCTVIPPKCSAHVDDVSNLVIRVEIAADLNEVVDEHVLETAN